MRHDREKGNEKYEIRQDRNAQKQHDRGNETERVQASLLGRYFVKRRRRAM